jgi:hypothetical protein
MRWTREYSHNHPGHGGEHFRFFTPLEWQSNRKRDASRKDFVFSLIEFTTLPEKEVCLEGRQSPRLPVNPHLPYWKRRFCDMGVYDDCNTNADSSGHCLGGVSTNDTRAIFVTVSEHLTVKEIEVLEIREIFQSPDCLPGRRAVLLSL